MDRKKSRHLERIFKGVANHWRVEIIFLIKKNPGITLEEISEKLKGNLRTISEHSKKLVNAGLVRKKYQGLFVKHTLSPYGEKMVEFIKNFK